MTDNDRLATILADLEQPGMPTFEVHQAKSRNPDHEWEYYAEVSLASQGWERMRTGRHRSLMACLAAVVEMARWERMENGR